MLKLVRKTTGIFAYERTHLTNSNKPREFPGVRSLRISRYLSFGVTFAGTYSREPTFRDTKSCVKIYQRLLPDTIGDEVNIGLTYRFQQRRIRISAHRVLPKFACARWSFLVSLLFVRREKSLSTSNGLKHQLPLEVFRH